MPAEFTPARVVINKPVPGPKGDPGDSGGSHTHPEYEHTHPYASDPHTHPEYVHSHPYASDTHNHDGVYALVHSHPYASDTHNHDSAYSATGHTHDYAATGHNHDGVYAPTHSHPYADVSHGMHVDLAESGDISTQAFGDSPAAGASSTEVAAADHKHGMPANPVTAHEAASDPHTGYLKENDPNYVDLTDGGATTLHSHAGGGTIDYAEDADISTQAFGDSPAAGASTTEVAGANHKHGMPANPVTAHEAAGDPHTGYRLESADHSHASTGMQAGKLAQANTHESPDTDSGTTALHHTLGTGANQAAAGNHSHGGGGGNETTLVVSSNQANSTTTPAVITELTASSLASGTYLFKVWVAYQAAATTTGIEMFANFTGTVSRFVSTWYTLTTGGAAATGIADQATTLTAQMMEGKGQRAKDAASGPTQGVDTANSDQFAVIEGLFIATGSGDFQVKFRSEVAASAVTIMPGTTLELRKVA